MSSETNNASNVSILSVTPETYEQEVLKSDCPVIVYYKAAWCGPCKQLSPMVQEKANENPCIKVVTIDCEAHKQFVMCLGISAVPTLQLMVNGEKSYTAIGGMAGTKFTTIFDKAVFLGLEMRRNKKSDSV